VSWSEEKEEEKKKPKSISEVMKVGFKGGKALMRKVTSTKKPATKEEAAELLSLLTDMSKAKPPKGEQESWDKLNKALVESAKEVSEGIAAGKDVEDAKKALKKAGNCAKCHKEHRPKK